jgi:hypothetical protein
MTSRRSRKDSSGMKRKPERLARRIPGELCVKSQAKFL